MTTRETLAVMLAEVSESRFDMERVAISAEEVPIPGWLALEIGRISLALGHVEAQLRLEIEHL